MKLYNNLNFINSYKLKNVRAKCSHQRRRHAKPEVMKLSDLMLKIPDYGTVQDINPSESGYYEPK